MVAPRAAPRYRALALVGAFILLVAGGGKPTSFIGFPPSAAARGSSGGRCAEDDAGGSVAAEDGAGGSVALEDPPSDEELMGNPQLEEQGIVNRRYPPKREIRGTLCYARRELNEEAARFMPIIEPLLMEQQLSIKELTFVLNRQGSKLRHLLYKPRQSLPVFTEHKVKRLCRRVRNEKGIKLHLYLRPQWLPPGAPGAPYPKNMGNVFAEVPPLKFISDSESSEQKKLPPQPAALPAADDVEEEAVDAEPEEPAPDSAEE